MNISGSLLAQHLATAAAGWNRRIARRKKPQHDARNAAFTRR
jgi:hypothetical protein